MSDAKELAYGVKQAAFDSRDAFHTLVEPKINEVNEICERYGIQIFVSVCSGAELNEKGVGFHMSASANLDPELMPMQLFVMHQIHQGDFQKAIDLLTLMKMHDFSRATVKPHA